MSICLLRKSTSSRAERLLRNKACCVGLRTRRACLTSEGQRRLTPISDCARNWDLDKIYRIGKLTEFTSATTRHRAFSASAVFPRPEVALSKVASNRSRPESIYPRPGVALSRGEKGLSRLVVAPSRHRGGLSSLGGALSGAAESAAKPNNISLDQIRKRTIVVT